MTGNQNPARENRRLMVALAAGVVVGAVSVALIWTALNELGRNTLTLAGGVTGGLGALVMLALIVWLWRYLTAMLPESQRSRQRAPRSRPTPSEKDR